MATVHRDQERRADKGRRDVRERPEQRTRLSLMLQRLLLRATGNRLDRSRRRFRFPPKEQRPRRHQLAPPTTRKRSFGRGYHGQAGCRRASHSGFVLETERLLLRPLAIADLDEFVALHDDPEVTRFIQPLDRPAAKERLQSIEREWLQRGHGMFAVLDRATGRLLGRAGLKYWPQFDETEIGWVLRREAWGHGYATEAAQACLNWAFASLDLPYFTAMIHPENEASIRLAGRLGMSRLRRDVLLGDPVVVFSLNRGDWSITQRQEA